MHSIAWTRSYPPPGSASAASRSWKVTRSLHAHRDRVLARAVDRPLVDVVPVDGRLRVGERDRDRGPAGAAADIGNPPAGAQRIVDAGQLRDPLAAQLGQEQRAVRVALSGEHVVAESLPRDAASGPKRGHQLRHRLQRRGERPRDTRGVGQRIAVQQHRGVCAGERVSPIRRVGARIVDEQVAVRCLVLEPFTRVALVDAGALGELRRGRGCVRNRLVEAELVAEVDPGELHRSLDRSEHLACEDVYVIHRTTPRRNPRRASPAARPADVWRGSPPCVTMRRQRATPRGDRATRVARAGPHGAAP